MEISDSRLYRHKDGAIHEQIDHHLLAGLSEKHQELRPGVPFQSLDVMVRI